jgi:hypothetical protein
MWKLYFILITIQALGNIFATIYIGPFHAMDVVNWMFIALALFGLFCYVFNRNTLDRRVFKLFVPVLVGWDFFFILWWIPHSVGKPVFNIDSVTVLLFVFLIPQYVALYRYGYEIQKSEHA